MCRYFVSGVSVSGVLVSGEQTGDVPDRALLGIGVSYVSESGDVVESTLAAVDAALVVRGCPVRGFPTYAGQANYPGLFWSATTGAHVGYESLLERDRLWVADFDRRVTWIAGQPFWFKGSDEGCPRRHVPDFLLRLGDEGFMVVDVKPQRMLDKPAVAEVLEWTGRLCAARGWGYEVWTGTDPTILENIKFLAVGRRHQFVDEEVLAAVATVGRSGMTVTRVESLVAGRPRGLVRTAVFSLLWSGRWTTDLSQPLSDTSVLCCGDAG